MEPFVVPLHGLAPFGPMGPGRGRRGRGGPGRRARRGDVRAAVLALLVERPMHGYEMIQELEERTGGVWRPSPGAVYPALQLLEDQGLVTADETEGKRRYQLTEAGRTHAEPRRSATVRRGTRSRGASTRAVPAARRGRADRRGRDPSGGGGRDRDSSGCGGRHPRPDPPAPLRPARRGARAARPRPSRADSAQERSGGRRCEAVHPLAVGRTGWPATRCSGTCPAQTARSRSASSSLGPPVRTLAEPSWSGNAEHRVCPYLRRGRRARRTRLGRAASARRSRRTPTASRRRRRPRPRRRAARPSGSSWSA